MRIPTYQIYNVLKHYTVRLTVGTGNRDVSGPAQARPVAETGFFGALNRRQIVETITEKIKKTVGLIQPVDHWEQKIETPPPPALPRRAAAQNGELTPFVYHVIDRDHHKVKRLLSVTRFYEP